jgi:hypothetical protein
MDLEGMPAGTRVTWNFSLAHAMHSSKLETLSATSTSTTFDNCSRAAASSDVLTLSALPCAKASHQGVCAPPAAVSDLHESVHQCDTQQKLAQHRLI